MVNLPSIRLVWLYKRARRVVATGEGGRMLYKGDHCINISIYPYSCQRSGTLSRKDLYI